MLGAHGADRRSRGDLAQELRLCGVVGVCQAVVNFVLLEHDTMKPLYYKVPENNF